jgi:hypothetical protein
MKHVLWIYKEASISADILLLRARAHLRPRELWESGAPGGIGGAAAVAYVGDRICEYK